MNRLDFLKLCRFYLCQIFSTVICAAFIIAVVCNRYPATAQALTSRPQITDKIQTVNRDRLETIVIFVPLPDLRVAYSSTNISEKRFVL